MIRSRLRSTAHYTRQERRLSRALLLSATMHFLREAREHSVNTGDYRAASFYDKKIMKRLDKIGEVLDDYYHGR